jgi:hypothetical protein
MRLRLCESAIASRFVFSPKIRDPATFDFCNTIGVEADIEQSASLRPDRFKVLEDWASPRACAIKPKSSFIGTAANTRPPPCVPVTVCTI